VKKEQRNVARRQTLLMNRYFLILFYSRGIRPSKTSFNKEGALT